MQLTHLTVKPFDISECKLLVSVSFLNDTQHLLLKIKLEKKETFFKNWTIETWKIWLTAFLPECLTLKKQQQIQQRDKQAD